VTGQSYSARPPFFPWVRGLVRYAIRETFALDAFEGLRRTFPVLNADCRTIRIAKVELSKVAVQVLLAAMLVHALHAAFENRVIALDGVRIDFPASLAVGVAVFLARVVHNAMRGKLFANRLVAAVLRPSSNGSRGQCSR
jgi:hypothetical protein